jgi:hypothetical protein
VSCGRFDNGSGKTLAPESSWKPTGRHPENQGERFMTTFANPQTASTPVVTNGSGANRSGPKAGAAAVPAIRRAQDATTIRHNLGFLADLPGLWTGTGFNLIARPDFLARSSPPGPADPAKLFLELNFTVDSLKFDTISSSIPNRGFAQPDIELYGLHYLQQISDANTGGALHIEPGLWVNIPATTSPGDPPTIARMASIPHGTTLLAEGTASSIVGGPTIAPANTVPFVVGSPIPGLGATTAFPEYSLVAPAPAPTFRTPADQVPGLTQAMIDDPNLILNNAKAGLDIISTVVLNVATLSSLTVLDPQVPPAPSPGTHTVTIPGGGGSTENIPFLGINANAVQVFATFWIETVRDPLFPARRFMQLQYSQTVLLNFPIDVSPSAANPNGILNFSWPHVSVATLTKDF